MRKGLYFTAAAALLGAALVPNATAQTRARAARPAAVAAQTPRLLASLPTSDGVVYVDAKRLLAEALPRAYNNNPAELARINSEIDKFKARTGLDARRFERIAVGTTVVRAASGSKTMETVALVQGAFDAAALVSAARAAAPATASVREEKHRGRSLYVLTVNEDVRLLGLFNLRVTDLGVAAVDSNTVALGKIERVRAALDAAATGGARVAPEVAALAVRNPNAVVGLGGNLPSYAFEGVRMPSAQLERNLNSIRQLSGFLATSEAGFQFESFLRTTTPAEARALGDSISGLRGLAGALIGLRYREPQLGLLRGVVEATRVTTTGDEVQVALALRPDTLAALIEAF